MVARNETVNGPVSDTLHVLKPAPQQSRAAQAIWDDVYGSTVASAAGITYV